MLRFGRVRSGPGHRCAQAAALYEYERMGGVSDTTGSSRPAVSRWPTRAPWWPNPATPRCDSTSSPAAPAWRTPPSCGAGRQSRRSRGVGHFSTGAGGPLFDRPWQASRRGRLGPTDASPGRRRQHHTECAASRRFRPLRSV